MHTTVDSVYAILTKNNSPIIYLPPDRSCTMKTVNNKTKMIELFIRESNLEPDIRYKI